MQPAAASNSQTKKAPLVLLPEKKRIQTRKAPTAKQLLRKSRTDWTNQPAEENAFHIPDETKEKETPFKKQTGNIIQGIEKQTE